jgi:hypothetical protein
VNDEAAVDAASAADEGAQGGRTGRAILKARHFAS